MHAPPVLDLTVKIVNSIPTSWRISFRDSIPAVGQKQQRLKDVTMQYSSPFDSKRLWRGPGMRKTLVSFVGTIATHCTRTYGGPACDPFLWRLGWVFEVFRGSVTPGVGVCIIMHLWPVPCCVGTRVTVYAQTELLLCPLLVSLYAFLSFWFSGSLWIWCIWVGIQLCAYGSRCWHSMPRDL